MAKTVECNSLKMVFLYLLISVLFYRILPFVSANDMGCILQEKYTVNEQEVSYDGVVHAAYDRDDLAIYTYKSTRKVNFLIDDVDIKFNGQISNNSIQDLSFLFETKIEGSAVLEINKTHSGQLTNCTLDLTKNVIYRNDVPVHLQDNIVGSMQSCIQKSLCAQIGNTNEDDFIRAQIIPHDFGEMSILYEIFHERYPHLVLPTDNSSCENGAQETLNLLAGFWIASLTTKIPGRRVGIIDLPIVNETIPGIPLINNGYFRLSNGTFGDLRTLERSQDVVLTHKGIEFSIGAGFMLPQAKIHFDHYALKYGLLDTSGKIDIVIKNLNFSMQVAINYNESPCSATLTYLRTQVGNITFDLKESSIFDGMISDITNKLLNKYIRNIINFVESKLYEVITGPLKSFDCEQFRP